MTEQNRLPFGAQFSPNQVDLPRLLQVIHDYAGDRAAITAMIRDEFFAAHDPSNRDTLALNVVLALRAYGLLGDGYDVPTLLADELLEIAGDADRLYGRFAQHILINLHGTDLLDSILMMRTAGVPVSLDSLEKFMNQRGLRVPRAAVYISSMRLWLAKARVFDAAATGARIWDFNQERVQQILGVELDEIDRLAQFDKRQRDFLRALTRFGTDEALAANKVADLATMLYGTEYNHKELPKAVLQALQTSGFITIQKSTGGQGAKPYLVWRTPKFQQEVSEPLLVAAAKKANLSPKEVYGKSLSEILADLDSSNAHLKGKALELLAFYLARLLDLQFKGWRLRSADTGGAEVDAIVEGSRLIFTRWQIQAKNTARVRLDDVAKEVGLSLTFIYSNVVLVVTTGQFTRDATQYADHVMRTSNLNVVLLNGADLKHIAHDPTDVVRVLSTRAVRAMELKERPDLFGKQ